MCGSVSSSWLLKTLRCVSVDGIHIQETTEPIPQQVQGSSRRHPSADLLNLPGPVATHGSSVLGFFFFFFLTSVLPLLYEIFSFFVVFKTFSSNRSKERAFWRRDDFSVTIFLKPYGLHFLQKEKEFSLLFLIAFSPKEKNKEKNAETFISSLLRISRRYLSIKTTQC